MKMRWLLALAVLGLASLACQTVLGTDTPAPPPVQNPADSSGEQSAQPAGPAGMDVAFTDDFSSTASGWDIADWENGATGYTADDRFEIIVRSPNYDIWANPGLYFTDARIEVDFVKDNGTDINDIGLICRYEETSDSFNFYYMVVGSDGYAGAYKVVNGESTVLQELEAGSLNVNPEGQVNHLRMDCIDNELTLYLNDRMVISVQDGDLSGGDVGLVAGVFDEPNLRVLFDNFVVYTP
jgi:hypothetical protein